jgi:hypothetical protein
MEEEHKTCTRCNKVKPLSEYHRASKEKDGRADKCKACCAQYHRDRMSKVVLENVPVPEAKTCAKCGENKSKACFGVTKATKDGLQSSCKMCVAITTRKFRTKNKAREGVQLPTTKICVPCGVEKPNNCFTKDPESKDGLRWFCRNCARDRFLKRTYGVGSDWFDSTLISQGGVCAICGFPSNRTLFIDHNHKNNKVRGLLCGLCNGGLGAFKDDPKAIKECVGYLVDSDLTDTDILGRRGTEDISYNKNRSFVQKLKLTTEQRRDISNSQNNRCKICNIPFVGKRMSLDHCHKTGKVRGMLCNECNRGLGYFKDNPAALQGAVDYLKKHGS